MMIEAGDGSWQKRLDAGQCPKCRHKLEPHTVIAGVREGTQLLKCPLCKLEIIQRDPKEAPMMETKLMPSEEDLCAVPEKMSWQDAVSCIEEFMLKRTALWSKDDDEEERVRAAWKRILQG